MFILNNLFNWLWIMWKKEQWLVLLSNVIGVNFEFNKFRPFLFFVYKIHFVVFILIIVSIKFKVCEIEVPLVVYFKSFYALSFLLFYKKLNDGNFVCNHDLNPWKVELLFRCCFNKNNYLNHMIMLHNFYYDVAFFVSIFVTEWQY